MNLSAKINPFHYDNTPPVEVIVLECIKCGIIDRRRILHSTSNKEIMTKHYIGWESKGYNKKTKTLCPTCVQIKKSKICDKKH